MNRRNFPQPFFEQPVLAVARNLLGALIETGRPGARTSGVIVEVEAYHESEPAAHSHRGRTARSEIMFGPGGYCYVYFIYGMHYCVNVVTEPEGIGAAVLIRAIEPVDGFATMKRRRRVTGHAVCNGPAKLCQALKIDRTFLGQNLRSSSKISVRPYRSFDDSEVAASRRIGISKAKTLPWRFAIRNNPWVSRG